MSSDQTEIDELKEEVRTLRLLLEKANSRVDRVFDFLMNEVTNNKYDIEKLKAAASMN